MNTLTRCIAILAISLSTLAAGGHPASAGSIPDSGAWLQVEASVVTHFDYHCAGRVPGSIQVVIQNNAPENAKLPGDRYVAASLSGGDNTEWAPAGAPEVFEHLSPGESTTYWFEAPAGSFTRWVHVYVTNFANGESVAISQRPYDWFPVTVNCPEYPDGDDPDGDDPDGDDPDGDDPDGDDPDGDDPDGDDPDGDDPVVPEGDTPDVPEAPVDEPVNNTPLFTG